jgi:hypothetical protein
MTMRIRYAWGHSLFGDFIVAVSDEEVVSFGLPLSGSDELDDLRRRFTDAVIEEDAEGLERTIAVCAHFLDHHDQHSITSCSVR